MTDGRKHIIIIGAGFGGIHAAKELLKEGAGYRITLIDSRNFHLFQPLLYQVAAAQLSPEDIAYPIRAIFKKYKNITVLNENVDSVDLGNKFVKVECGKLTYDKLIIAVGVKPDYFGNEDWMKIAPPLKTLENAIAIRKKILSVFERAESEMLHPCEENPLNFVIIGGGPTGVELSGALAELRRYSLKNEFRRIKPERAKIYLIEAGKNILPGFPDKLVKAAGDALQNLGVTVLTGSFVTSIQEDKIVIKKGNSEEEIHTKVAVWAAGVKAKFGENILSANRKVTFDKKGRVVVNKDLTVADYRDVYVVGDFSSFIDERGKQLPGTAPVAIQQGVYAAKHIRGKISSGFIYFNKGSLSVIGRNAAVGDFGKLQLSGFAAWALWVFVHIGYLIGFNNKFFVMSKWSINYLFRKPAGRIIFGVKQD